MNEKERNTLSDILAAIVGLTPEKQMAVLGFVQGLAVANSAKVGV